MNNIIKILKQVIAEVNNSLKKTKQDLTPEQQARIRENIGILLSDWSDNNEESASYIQNRPFYEDESGQVHTLDDKFIPASIARISDLANIITDKDAEELLSELQTRAEGEYNNE